jgi:OOP family OmpA-OmpF porin
LRDGVKKGRLLLTLLPFFLYLIMELNMNKNLLCAALLAGLGMAQAASAQDAPAPEPMAAPMAAPMMDASSQTYDDRWYVTGSLGMNLQDNIRGTRNTPFGTLGFGKFFAPQWSIDLEANYQQAKFDGTNNILTVNPTAHAQDLNWSQYGVSLDVRRHFITPGRAWNPYVLAGLGYQRSEEEFDRAYAGTLPAGTPPLLAANKFGGVTCDANKPCRRKHGNAAAKFGIGLQGDLGRVSIRTELALRVDGDDNSFAARFHDSNHDDGKDYFHDVLASVGVVIPLGAAPMAPVGPAPVAAPNCADMDDDGDGVNNCNDKCPGSQAGQTIGPDGCPVPVSIDLKGVNFDFDKSKLRPDAVVILNQAIDILKRYPQLKVEVAGHTDLCGSDAYNQKLSERRAHAVYDYLTSNGVDAARLVGPNGYGESRPLEQTPQTYPACKSETNRRTELNVQN